MLRPIALCAFVTGLGAQAGLTVTATAPSPNERAASTAAAIEVWFSETVDAGSLTSRSLHVFGRWSGVVPGRITLSADARIATFEPERPYAPGEHVMVTLSDAIRSQSGQQLTGGHSFVFWTAPASGSFRFTQRDLIPFRRPGDGRTRAYGVYAGDLDGDGSPEITAANEVSSDFRVLRNDGCGNYDSLTVYSLGPGQQPSPTEGADFDGDGFLDVVSGNGRGNSISVCFGDGQGGYRAPVLYDTGGFTHGVTVLDANGDGHPDIAAPNATRVALFLNNGDGTFGSPSLLAAGGGEDNVAAADADGDGLLDLFVGNLASEDVTVLRRTGAATFAVSSTTGCGGGPFQIAVGDVNGDGDVDAVTANRTTDTIGVLFGDGAGGLTLAATYPTGATPVAIDLGDLDGDGDLDCVSANFNGSDHTIYRNDGSGQFGSPLTLPSTQTGSCSTLVDFDRDGDLDIIATDELADEARLYAQDGPLHAGSQPPTCGATLRINNLAGRAGFGGAPPTAMPLGRTVFFGVSGAPQSIYAVFFARSLEPGFVVPGLGQLNLDLTSNLVTVVSGATLDGHGEALHAARVPLTFQLGSAITVQAIVADAGSPLGFTLTNPETGITTR